MGLVAIIAFFVLVMVVSGRHAANKRKKALADLYADLVARHDLRITAQDTFFNRMLAIDEEKGMLLYVDKIEELKSQTIALRDVGHVKIVNSGIRIVEAKKNGRTRIEDHCNDFSLVLILTDKSVIDLPLFSETLDGPLERPGAMSLARKWEERIQGTIRRAERLLVSV